MPDRRGDVRLCSRIMRRRVIFGMLAAGCAAAWSGAASAVPAPAPERARVYAAFFLGQGGYAFSWGIPRLEAEARNLGFATEVFSYSDLNQAWAAIARRRKEGYKIALVGYSLGNTTATYLQRYFPVDLLLAIAESSLGQNHPIRKENTKRSVLWYGPDSLSNAGVRDGFNEINYVESTHLLMDLDPHVVAGVIHELQGLATQRRDERAVAARVPTPRPKVAATDDKPAKPAAPAEAASAGTQPSAPAVASDVTCGECWGFRRSPGTAQPDPWLR